MRGATCSALLAISVVMLLNLPGMDFVGYPVETSGHLGSALQRGYSDDGQPPQISRFGGFQGRQKEVKGPRRNRRSTDELEGYPPWVEDFPRDPIAERKFKDSFKSIAELRTALTIQDSQREFDRIHGIKGQPGYLGVIEPPPPQIKYRNQDPQMEVPLDQRPQNQRFGIPVQADFQGKNEPAPAQIKYRNQDRQIEVPLDQRPKNQNDMDIPTKVGIIDLLKDVIKNALEATLNFLEGMKKGLRSSPKGSKCSTNGENGEYDEDCSKADVGLQMVANGGKRRRNSGHRKRNKRAYEPDLDSETADDHEGEEDKNDKMPKEKNQGNRLHQLIFRKLKDTNNQTINNRRLRKTIIV